MNLQQLYFLKAVVECESFTKAAAVCNVTQSSLSHGIIQLEEELNARLIERTRERAYLTKYGQIYYPYVKRFLVELENGKRALEDVTEVNHGRVSLAYNGCLEDLCSRVVLDYLVQDDRRDVKFDYYSTDAPAVKKLIMDGIADLGVSTYPEDTGLKSVYVGHQPIVLAVYKNTWFSDRTSVSLQELTGIPMIGYQRDFDLGKYLHEAFIHAQCVPDIRHIGVTDSGVLSFVSAGCGVALIPKPFRPLASDIRLLEIEDSLPERRIYLLWRNERYMTNVVKDFRRYFLSQMAGNL